MVTTLKGFRDFLLEEMKIRNLVIDTLKEVFASFGFEPLETPALEYGETLLGKYGAEAEKLVYTFKDRGGRLVGLKYDLTVPLARVVAQYQNELAVPFKRYQIQPVWRAEKPQRGRLREFYQCDIDTVGIASPLADAEIIACTVEAFKKLGFKKFTVRINSRQVLFKLLDGLGIRDQKQQLSILQSIDKLDRLSEEEVKKELLKKKLASKSCGRLFKKIKTAKADENLEKIIKAAKAFGVGKEYLKFDPTLVRGLDYYTGPIFEVFVEEPKIGSLAGGGRYDKLIGELGGRDLPATGISLGLERIVEVIKEFDLLPIKENSTTKVLVTIFDESLVGDSQKLCMCLRSIGVNTEIYLDPKAKLDKQIKYADRKGIPFVAILGPEEVGAKKVALKDLRTGKQVRLDPKGLGKLLLQP